MGSIDLIIIIVNKSVMGSVLNPRLRGGGVLSYIYFIIA